MRLEGEAVGVPCFIWRTLKQTAQALSLAQTGLVSSARVAGPSSTAPSTSKREP
jgi:hypothetical protein